MTREEAVTRLRALVQALRSERRHLKEVETLAEDAVDVLLSAPTDAQVVEYLSELNPHLFRG